MTERYTKLFSLPENLYAAGSPVIIAAGALLKDNQTGDVLAQLKLRSISEKPVQAVKVCLNLFDTAGSPIDEPVLFDYLDLRAARDAEFGKKTPVPLSESKARSYAAAVTEVIFSDKSTWTSDGAKWEPLPRQRTMEEVFQDTELVRQYKITFGNDFSLSPMQEKDLWFCACGALNHEGKPCHVCNRTLPELQSIDRERLVRDKDARLSEEARRAAEEKAAADAQRKETAKLLKIVIPAVCVLIAAAALVKFAIIPTMKYNDALSLMNAGLYEEAIASFEALDGYKDSTQKIKDCETAILDGKYNAAFALMEEGKFKEAIAAFEALNGYRDSKDRIQECKDALENLRLQKLYDAAEEKAKKGKTAEAAIAFGKLGDFRDSRERSFALWDTVAVRDTICVDDDYTVGLKSDGTVVAVGVNEEGQCNVSCWRDIVAVSAGFSHTVALKSDGTVVAVGNNEYGQCNVSGWKDIVAVSAGGHHTVGLKSDGTVVAVGSNNSGQCDVFDWTGIVAISVDVYYTVGLKSDGTVVAVGYLDDRCNVNDWTDIVTVSTNWNHFVGLKTDGTVVAVADKFLDVFGNEGQLNVRYWTDISSVSAGYLHTVGLRSDGTVVALGHNDVGQCNVKNWTGIVAVSAGWFHTVGLKSDGTVVAVGSKDFGQCDVSGWTDIVDVRAGENHTIGFKSDGTVVAVGDNSYGQCDVSNWTDIKLPK